MRAQRKKGGLKVYAVSGSHVILLGIHLPEEECEGLLGFSVLREDHTEGERYYLKASKVFEETDPRLKPGTQYSTHKFPIQSFQWADYSAKPGYAYTYEVSALKGTPAHLTVYATVRVAIRTEKEEDVGHNVFFNRGSAASQEYVRRFGDVSPKDVPDNRAFEWLSRGAYEALVSFVESCGPEHSLRIAAYEFHYRPFLEVIGKAMKRGVDVRIVYDGRKEYPRLINEAAIRETGLASCCTPRLNGKSCISHNKFILKLERGRPVSVWTGGMNFSEGGIFGHSNVAHVVNNPAIAERYARYWEALRSDPENGPMKKRVEEITPAFALPFREEEMVVFSPRTGMEVLENYAGMARSARHALFMTFAFGMNEEFRKVYQTARTPLRYALMEKACMAGKDREKFEREKKEIEAIRRKKENVFAIGNMIRTNRFDGWLRERLTGLNSNVKYIHNKFMLIDPLGKNPIVVTGSANFSVASTKNNDENMVIVRGNQRVADIYLGEYMRLFSHYSFRESLQWRDPLEKPKYLRTDDWWKDYFRDNARGARRKYFAQVSE